MDSPVASRNVQLTTLFCTSRVNSATSAEFLSQVKCEELSDPIEQHSAFTHTDTMTHLRYFLK